MRGAFGQLLREYASLLKYTYRKSFDRISASSGRSLCDTKDNKKNHTFIIKISSAKKRS
jgi:hypothetical protein